MITYAETQIAPEDLVLFRSIRHTVNHLPQLDLGATKDGNDVEMSCHLLAEAVARVWNLEVAHGVFLKGYNHSWTVTSNKNVIDVYPVASVGGPIIYDGSALTVLRQLFNPFSPSNIEARYGKDFGSMWFERAVDTLALQLHKLSRLSPAQQ
ncbi:hypothetical protein KW785_00210 [Candidatus Parcubacteria bacterium]|nr:hypothetical protein [Candidatus Parcubacteria bacterium]